MTEVGQILKRLTEDRDLTAVLPLMDALREAGEPDDARQVQRMLNTLYGEASYLDETLDRFFSDTRGLLAHHLVSPAEMVAAVIAGAANPRWSGGHYDPVERHPVAVPGSLKAGDAVALVNTGQGRRLIQHVRGVTSMFGDVVWVSDDGSEADVDVIPF